MIGHYVSIALRNLRRAPLTALVNVLTLALGLVAFVAAYAVVVYWGSSDRHFANADRTYAITANLALRDGSITTGTWPQTTDFYERYLRLEFPEFETIARARVWNRQSTISAEGRGARVISAAVDPAFLDIFPLPFIVGDPRTALQSPNGLLLTEATALRLFGSTDVLGKTVTLGGNLLDATVTGVIGKIPEPTHLGSARGASVPFEIMAPYALYEKLAVIVNRPQTPPSTAAANPSAAPASGDAPVTPETATDGSRSAAANAAPADAPPPTQNENWLGNYCCTTYAMLKHGSNVSAATLNARLRDFAVRRMSPEQLKMATVEVGAVPLRGLTITQLNAQLLGGASGWLSITTVLLGLGSLVLLVACLNYANLATARAARRAREIGLRKVIGARRSQLVAQYLLEAGVLTAAALALAVVVVAIVAPIVKDAVGVDLRAATFGDAAFLGFLGALLVGVTLLGGAYPAFVLSRVRPIEALRLGRIRLGPRFASTMLVGAQFAAASFLLIAVFVMYSQNAALARTGLGSTRDQHLVLNNFRPVTGVDNDLLRTELERLPQVKGVTASGQAPWADGINLNLFARTPEETTSLQTAFQNNVGYDFFETLDIPLLAGRTFDREHNDLAPPGEPVPDAPPVSLVIDRVLSQQLGFRSPAEAVDQIVYFPAVLGEVSQQFRIVGVVDSRPLFLRGAGATSSSYSLRADLQNTVVRLSADDIGGGVAAVEAVWRRLAPGTPIQRSFMDDLFNESFEIFARVNQVVVGLAGVAFFISVIGLFGMAIQVAGRRTHEIGVRKSVGARKTQIVRMLLTDFSKPVVVANLAAWVLGYFAAKAYLGVFIQRITLTPLPFVASLAVVVGIAWLAVTSQALRAARANPAKVLRVD